MFRRYKRGIVLAKTIVPLDSDQFGLHEKKTTKHFTIETYAISGANIETRKMTVFYPNTFRAAFHAENLVGGGIAAKHIKRITHFNFAQIVGDVIESLIGFTTFACMGFGAIYVITESKLFGALAGCSALAWVLTAITTVIACSILSRIDTTNVKIPGIFRGFLRICVDVGTIFTPESRSTKFMCKNLPDLD